MPGTDSSQPRGYTVRAPSECSAITGFACDPDFVNGPIKVDFHDFSTNPPTYLGQATTDRHWDAASDKYCGDSSGTQHNYGYTFTIPSEVTLADGTKYQVKDGKVHDIKGFGINVNSAGSRIDSNATKPNLHTLLTVATGSDMKISCTAGGTTTIQGVTFNGQALSLDVGQPATSIKLSGSTDVPVVVQYSSGAPRNLTIKFNYNSTTAGPCVGDIRFDTVADNTTFTAGSTVNLAGWSAFCSGPNGTNRDRVDLHLLNKSTNKWLEPSLVSNIPSVPRPDVVALDWTCGNKNANNDGWSYDWVVPNTPGNFILRAASVNDPAAVCNKVIDRNITIK